MRIVFMGTPDFSVPALEEIAKHHEVVAVVTQKDKPKGRGQEMAFTPVKESALKLNIPIYAITFGSSDERELSSITELTNAKIFDGKSGLKRAFTEVRSYS